jgi:hypothetical protein
MQSLKTKEDRLKEGLHLLLQIREAGVTDKVQSFVDLKDRISEWVSTGKAWDGTIEFAEYGRYAVISLPKSANVFASLAFKRRRHI